MALRFVLIVLLMTCTVPALAWQDKTHVAIAKAAGYKTWFNAAAADITKSKAGDKEGGNHYFDNLREERVTPEMVLAQAKLYDYPGDEEEGHLYGAIIASIRKHLDKYDPKDPDKFVGYNMDFAAHYVGDLCRPNHNIPFIKKDGFPSNKEKALEWHVANDGVVEKNDLDQLVGEIRKRADKISITLRKDHFEEDLATEIARIANISRDLGEKLRARQGVMTPEEAYGQLAQGAALLRVIQEYAIKQ